MLNSRSERPNLGSKWPDLGSERPNLGPEGGQTNEQMDEQKSLCVIQDFVPFGTAAQKTDLRPERSGGPKGDKVL